MKPITASVFLLMTVLACIEPYPITITLDGTVLTVQGFLTDRPSADTISIKYSEAKSRSYFETPVVGAKVRIVTQGQTPVALIEAPNGKYYTPTGFRGEAGKRYQLTFTMTNGNRYESDLQQMATVPEIEKIYDAFDAQGIVSTDANTTIPANLIYIDTKDPANEQNFYLWRYTHYEIQEVCMTCDRGYFDNLRPGECDVPSAAYSTSFDYRCNGFCWEILTGTQINVFSDINSNGATIEGRQVAQIPLYSRYFGCLVVVEQLGISAEAYRYYKILESQTQSSGGLTDSPPAPIIGNIVNTNSPTEPVVGYFTAAQVKEKRHWVSRLNATGLPINLLGRPTNYEMPSPISRPPRAPCKPSATRTPIKPQGWGW